jgi:hypothetical protein
VSSLLRGAADRAKAHSGGYFIDETAMRKLDNTSMSNALLSKVTGLMATPGPGGAMFFVSAAHPCRSISTGCRQPNCFVKVLIDGVQSTDRPQPDFARMSPSDYAIVEFYPSGASVPPQYGGVNDTYCGVLLLWTRER